MYDYGARFYDAQLARWHGVDPLAEKYAAMSPYSYVMNNPLRLVDNDGLEPKPPKLLLIFYHGGPFGSGNIKKNWNDDTGGAGVLYNDTYKYAKSKGFDVKGAIIAPAATDKPGVMTGKKFLKNNYNKGDKIIIYGYSYGGDNAVNLAEAADDLGIPVDLLIIVDSSDGPFRGLTVDTSVPDNVEDTYNFYQTETSGNSSKFSNSNSDNPNKSENSSSDGSSDSPGSRGFPHSAEGNNRVNNIRLKGKGLTHGTIQTDGKTNIFNRIKNAIDEF